MIVAGIVNSKGTLLRVVRSKDQAQVDANVCDGEQLVPEPPRRNCWWDSSGAVWKDRPDRPSESHQWDEDAKAWVDRRTMADLRVAKWAEIKAAREAAATAGFVWDGSRFDSGPTSQRMLTIAAAAAGAGSGKRNKSWTLADDTVRVLSRAETVALGVALDDFLDGLQATSRALRTAIYRADITPEQLAAITWPT